jgi:predicted membrane protein
MENQNIPSYSEDTKRNRQSKKPIGGLVLILVGVGLLAHKLGLGLPHWLISWPMILIVIGFFMGLRQSFHFGGWVVLIFLGLGFTIEKEFLDYDMRELFWPVAIILMGLFMLFRPGRKRFEKGFGAATADTSAGDFIDSSVVFGGIQKNIISKNFQGGRIENLFGGTDLNMSQADFTGTVVLDFNVAFGGVKLVVPPTWNVKNEVTVILGGIDDKRPIVPDTAQNKVLILRGTLMFGGIDLKSY